MCFVFSRRSKPEVAPKPQKRFSLMSSHPSVDAAPITAVKGLRSNTASALAAGATASATSHRTTTSDSGPLNGRQYTSDSNSTLTSKDDVTSLRVKQVWLEWYICVTSWQLLFFLWLGYALSSVVRLRRGQWRRTVVPRRRSHRCDSRRGRGVVGKLMLPSSTHLPLA